MNRHRIAALVRKDLRELFRNKQSLSPLIALPAIFVVVMPVAFILLGSNPAVLASVNGLGSFLENLPHGAMPPGLTTKQTMVYATTVFFLAPLFLMIPVMVASITASSAFVGEKERKTIEGLLYTPLTDRELVLGKVLTSVILSVGLAWASFIVYAIIVNGLGGLIMGRVFFPTATWVVMILVLVPLVAILATCLIVAASGRATTMQGAQGLSVLIILPVLALVIGQATGLMLFNVGVVLIACATLLVVDIAVYLAVVRTLNRERIITKLV